MFSKNEEKSFDTLEEMVHYFRRIPLIPVTTDEEVLLGRAMNPEKVIDNAFFSKILLIKDGSYIPNILIQLKIIKVNKFYDRHH
jgi:hypothetical protein